MSARFTERLHPRRRAGGKGGGEFVKKLGGYLNGLLPGQTYTVASGIHVERHADGFFSVHHLQVSRGRDGKLVEKRAQFPASSAATAASIAASRIGTARMSPATDADIAQKYGALVGVPDANGITKIPASKKRVSADNWEIANDRVRDGVEAALDRNMSPASIRAAAERALWGDAGETGDDPSGDIRFAMISLNPDEIRRQVEIAIRHRSGKASPPTGSESDAISRSLARTSEFNRGYEDASAGRPASPRAAHSDAYLRGHHHGGDWEGRAAFQRGEPLTFKLGPAKEPGKPSAYTLGKRREQLLSQQDQPGVKAKLQAISRELAAKPATGAVTRKQLTGKASLPTEPPISPVKSPTHGPGSAESDEPKLKRYGPVRKGPGSDTETMYSIHHRGEHVGFASKRVDTEGYSPGNKHVYSTHFRKRTTWGATSNTTREPKYLHSFHPGTFWSQQDAAAGAVKHLESLKAMRQKGVDDARAGKPMAQMWAGEHSQAYISGYRSAEGGKASPPTAEERRIVYRAALPQTYLEHVAVETVRKRLGNQAAADASSGPFRSPTGKPSLVSVTGAKPRFSVHVDGQFVGQAQDPVGAQRVAARHAQAGSKVEVHDARDGSVRHFEGDGRYHGGGIGGIREVSPGSPATQNPMAVDDWDSAYRAYIRSRSLTGRASWPADMSIMRISDAELASRIAAEEAKGGKPSQALKDLLFVRDRRAVRKVLQAHTANQGNVGKASLPTGSNEAYEQMKATAAALGLPWDDKAMQRQMGIAGGIPEVSDVAAKAGVSTAPKPQHTASYGVQSQTGRSSSGKLRNFGAMGYSKFSDILDQVLAEDNDPEAVSAVKAEARKRGMWKVPQGDAPEAHAGAELPAGPTKLGMNEKVANPSGPTTDDGTIELTKAAGGTTGAMFGRNAAGDLMVVKSYAGNADRVATEWLANQVYQAVGAPVPKGGLKMMGGKPVYAYKAEPGTPGSYSLRVTKPSAALGKWFMTDALLANYDVVGLEHDNLLWPEGTTEAAIAGGNLQPVRIDQGGSFQFRAQGKPKEYGPVPLEVESMMSDIGQAQKTMAVSDQAKKDQAAHIAATLTPDVVDKLVAAAPFQNEKMREEVRVALKARVAWMGKLADAAPFSEPSAAPPAQAAATQMLKQMIVSKGGGAGPSHQGVQSGRGPHGQLRNFKAMSDTKFNMVFAQVMAENNDHEGIAAVTAEKNARKGNATAPGEVAGLPGVHSGIHTPAGLGTIHTHTAADIGSLAGQHVVVTGALTTGTRTAIHGKIAMAGGKPQPQITNATTLLVVGDKPGSKLAKAKAAGIPVITEHELLKLTESLTPRRARLAGRVGELLEATAEWQLLEESAMTMEQRKGLPKSAFAIPEKAPGPGSYPIHDKAHARNALARASGKPVEARVRAAVLKRYPELRSK